MVQRPEGRCCWRNALNCCPPKPWKEAQAVADALQADSFAHWQSAGHCPESDPNWACVDNKYPLMIEDRRAHQLLVVWGRLQRRPGTGRRGRSRRAAPLPPVPVWAERLRVARGLPLPTRRRSLPSPKWTRHPAGAAAIPRPPWTPGAGEGRAGSRRRSWLPRPVGGRCRTYHSRNMVGIWTPPWKRGYRVRWARCMNSKHWQRWRADQLREELVAKAEALCSAAQGHGGRRASGVSSCRGRSSRVSGDARNLCKPKASPSKSQARTRWRIRR